MQFKNRKYGYGTILALNIGLLAQIPVNAQQFAYIANRTSSSVSVVNTSSHQLATTIQLPLNSNPRAVAITPNGALVYVANFLSNSVTIINTSSNTVSTSVSVGTGPSAGRHKSGGNPRLRREPNVEHSLSDRHRN